MNRRFACILLAAGYSSRMIGKNKLLLKLGNQTLVEKSAITIQKVAAGLAQASGTALVNSTSLTTVAVTTEALAEVQKHLKTLHFNYLTVKDPSGGMHASIRKGLEHLTHHNSQNNFDAFFLCFADQPFLEPQVFETLMREYPDGQDAIVVPEVWGSRRQPVLIGKSFIPEILAHADGDFGCAYLLQNHKSQVKIVSFDNPTLFEDIDRPSDYARLLPDPTESIHELCAKLHRERKPYVLATVIEVMGSSSARTGSKAVFDSEGNNLLGWVGGGCAEQHIGQQSTEVLAENRARIVLADLDDEIYGLGVACGGKMNVFLEPVLPAETVEIETDHPNEAVFLGRAYGWNLKTKPKSNSGAESSISELLLSLAHAVGKKRNRSLTSLSELKNIAVSFKRVKRKASSRVTIVGATRITEALDRHFQLLGLTTRVVGPLLKKFGEEEGPEISFEPGERVIVASHTTQDPHIVSKILKQDVSYVAMVGSEKRANELLKVLEIAPGAEIQAPLYCPAGLDIDAKNPDEVALSIVAESLSVTEN